MINLLTVLAVVLPITFIGWTVGGPALSIILVPNKVFLRIVLLVVTWFALLAGWIAAANRLDFYRSDLFGGWIGGYTALTGTAAAIATFFVCCSLVGD